MCSGCSRTRTCFFGQEYKKTKLNMKNVLQGLRPNVLTCCTMHPNARSIFTNGLGSVYLSYEK